MRPRIEGAEHDRVVEMVEAYYRHLSPTQLIEMLINNHYHTLKSLCPSGEDIQTDDDTSKNKASLSK